MIRRRWSPLHARSKSSSEATANTMHLHTQKQIYDLVNFATDCEIMSLSEHQRRCNWGNHITRHQHILVFNQRLTITIYLMTGKCYVRELLDASVASDVVCGSWAPASVTCCCSCCIWLDASFNICCCFADCSSTNVDIIFWLPTINLPLQLSTQLC